MSKDGKQSYYEVLDVSFNANPEVIRTAYIRAKNAYNRDSLAAYSLFDREESRRILEEIEEAYAVLSDSEKRRQYDESHGIVSSESVYEAYHRGNHAVAAFARAAMADEESYTSSSFSFENDPFRKQAAEQAAAREKPAASAAPAPAPAAQPEISPIERLKNIQEIGQTAVGARNYQLSRSHETNPEMEERIKNCAGVNGAWLKSVREYKRVSADEIMNVLKISKNYLTALEEDDVTRLPANVFVRGFVIQYGKALKLDHDKVATSYMEFLRSKRPG
jgi:curved DNA-binding protein CbpA